MSKIPDPTGNERVFSVGLVDYCANQGTNPKDYTLRAASFSFETDSFHHYGNSFSDLEEKARVLFDKERQEMGAEAIIDVRPVTQMSSQSNNAYIFLLGTALIRKS